MARRATVIKRERAKETPVLVLDAGNALAHDREPAKKTQGQSSVTVMNMMGYDVVGLGPKDLRLGVKALQQRIAEADFAFVAANVFISETGALLAEPYVLRDMDGYQVAIVGISASAKRPGMRIEDPLETAQRIVPEASARADVIILLTQVSSNKAHEIVNKVPGIDLVIGGGNKGQVGLRYSKTQVPVVCADRSSPGHAGRYLGLAHLGFDAAGELLDIQWQTIALTAKNAPNDPAVLEWSNSQPRR